MEPAWREQVRLAASRARENPFITLAQLGKSAGWTQPAIIAFCEKGTGKEEKVQRLAVELRQLGILEDTTHVLAGRFRAMADMLDSPGFDRDTKIVELGSFVMGAYDALNGWTAALKKSKNDGIETMGRR